MSEPITRWAIACFEEPLCRSLGPLWQIRMLPRLAGDYDNCWKRFLETFGEPNDQASRRRYRKRGYRRVKIHMTLEMAPVGAKEVAH